MFLSEKQGLRSTLCFSAVGRLALPASFSSPSLCDFCSELISALSSALWDPDAPGNREGTEQKQRGEVVSPGSYSQSVVLTGPTLPF